MSRTRKHLFTNLRGYSRWGIGRHPSSYAKKWRREARVRQNRELRLCGDYEELQIETKLGKLTSLHDWY